jgi:hypothetical protein
MRFPDCLRGGTPAVPPETGPISDPNNAVLSRELYDLILRVAIVPVILFLIGLSWVIINRLMSPQARQARRNREIRKAVAKRQAHLAAAEREKTVPEERP